MVLSDFDISEVASPALASRIASLLSSSSLRVQITQKPYITWSLGSKALKHESLEP